MAQVNYRTINVDVLDPESSVNFPLDTLLPSTLPAPTDANTAAGVATQVRQMLRGGDPEGALRYVLDTAPLGGDDRAKEVHLATVIEVLQGIRQGEMTRILEAVCTGQGGSERADCLMKYMYVLPYPFYLYDFMVAASLRFLFFTATRAWLKGPPRAAKRASPSPRSLRARRGSRRSSPVTWVKPAPGSR